MFKLVLLVTLFNIAYVSTHSERPGKFLEHDRSIVNCARYKREANQHTCVLAPFATEGPYFLADDLERSDITDGQTGVNLDLNLKLTNAKDCSPLSGYYVHIWNANALGHYSGVQEFNKFPKQTFRPKPIFDTRWLRGYQVTNEDGEVNFKTIVPGWYYGRCLHIHVEVYSKNTTDTNAITYIGQLYFKRELPVQLKLVEPYSSNLNEMIFNEQDKVFNGMHGNDTITELIFEENNAKTSFILALDPTVTTFTNGTVVN